MTLVYNFSGTLPIIVVTYTTCLRRCAPSLGFKIPILPGPSHSPKPGTVSTSQDVGFFVRPMKRPLFFQSWQTMSIAAPAEETRSKLA